MTPTQSKAPPSSNDRASAVARASAAFKLNIPDLAARVISFSVFQLDLSNRWCAWLSKEERRDEETVVQAACRVGLALDNLVLPIQGPPGAVLYRGTDNLRAGAAREESGCDRDQPQGHTQVSGGCRKATREIGLMTRVHCGTARRLPIPTVGRSLKSIQTVRRCRAVQRRRQRSGSHCLVWSREEFVDSVDVLFVDAAGQMSLTNVLLCAGRKEFWRCWATRSSWNNRNREATRRVPTFQRSPTCLRTEGRSEMSRACFLLKPGVSAQRYAASRRNSSMRDGSSRLTVLSDRMLGRLPRSAPRAFASFRSTMRGHRYAPVPG